MEIKTSNPVIIDGDKANSSNFYSNAAGTANEQTYTAGDLNIKTSYPVVLDGSDVSPADYYASADGTPGMPEQAAMKQKGMFWDKTKGAWAKISNSPGAQFALEKVAEFMKMKQGGGFGSGGYTGGVADSTPTPTTTDTTPAPMTMTTKIIIGVGIVAVLGLVGYGIFASSKK